MNLTLLASAALSICLVAPVPGPVVAGFAPVGQYGGHWGIDFAAPFGTAVGAPAPGVVTFSGVVAGMRSVTIEMSPGYKVSVSYLSAITVETGAQVSVGQTIGGSGLAHGRPAVHVSLRYQNQYLDPARFFECRQVGLLYLLPPPDVPPYSERRAQRPPRRHIRSTPHRSPSRR